MKKPTVKEELKVLAVFFLILAIGLGFYVHSVNGKSIKQITKSTCALDYKQFTEQVNVLRLQKGLQPVILSDDLHTAAAAHISDMETAQYYGHTNPQNKHTSQYFINLNDKSAGYSSEILDGPQNAANAFDDFKNSPEHLAAILNPVYTKIGISSVQTNESYAVYDDNGNLESPAGKYHSTCTVVAELADK
jgi:uncharacterized protein YkwD